MAVQSLETLKAATTKRIPIRRNPGVLPPGSILIKIPNARGPELDPVLTKGIPQIDYGQHIYGYNNIRTNQVVYSLSRQLNNAASIAQLPFLGKKTVPAKLRKDLWHPFFLCTFPSAAAGLVAYRRLREFRRLHETNYPRSVVADPANPKCNLPKKKKGKVLMDQKANSVADLAAVLKIQEKGPGRERMERFKRAKKAFDRLKSSRAKKVEGKTGPMDVGKELKGVSGVEVFWNDVSDAEFAPTWPQEVVHKVLGRHRYTAAWPPVEVDEIEGIPNDEDEVEEVEEEEEAGNAWNSPALQTPTPPSPSRTVAASVAAT